MHNERKTRTRSCLIKRNGNLHTAYTNNDVCAQFHAVCIKTESNDHSLLCKRAKTEIFPFKRLQVQFPSLNNAFTVYEETATFIRDFWRVIGIWMVFCKKEQQGLSARKHVNNLPISKKPLFTRRKFPKSVYSTAHGSLTEVPSHEYLSTNLATSKVNL